MVIGMDLFGFWTLKQMTFLLVAMTQDMLRSVLHEAILVFIWPQRDVYCPKVLSVHSNSISIHYSTGCLFKLLAVG